MKKYRKILEDIYPYHKAEIYTKNILDNDMDLSIIIPVFNQEKYIQECLQSVLTQETEYSVEVIVINDGSTDHTGEILENYKDSIHLIRQENLGFSGARNSGLRHFRGKYVMFLDSDDLLMPGAVDSLISKAYETNADIVEGGMNRLIFDSSQWISRPYIQKKNDISFTGLDFLYGFPVGKIYRSSLWKNYKFPDDFWFEDTLPYMMIYPQKNMVVTINKVVYLYRMNNDGISFTYKGKPKAIDSYWITENLLYFQQQEGLINESTKKQYLDQTLINMMRASSISNRAQKAVFKLSADLYEKYFKNIGINNLTERQKHMHTALKSHSWFLFLWMFR